MNHEMEINCDSDTDSVNKQDTDGRGNNKNNNDKKKSGLDGNVVCSILLEDQLWLEHPPWHWQKKFPTGP